MKSLFLGMLICTVLYLPSCGATKNLETVSDSEESEFSIEFFDASPPWGDAPLSTQFYWVIGNPAATPLQCLIDAEGDGVFDEIVDDCASGGTFSFIFTEPGVFKSRLVVQDGMGRSLERAIDIYSNFLKFAGNVVFPEKADGFMDARVGENDVVLLFKEGYPVPQIRAGDILWGTSGYGYIRKVVSVSLGSGIVEMETAYAVVEEAVEYGTFGVRDTMLEFTDIVCTEGCDDIEEAVLYGTPAGNSSSNPQIFSLAPSVNANLTYGDLTVNSSVSIKPSLSIGIEISKFFLDIGFFELRKFEFEIQPRVEASADVEVSFPGPGCNFTKSLGKIWLPTIPIGPIVIAPMIEPEVFLEFGGPQVAWRFKASATMSGTGGIRYDSGAAMAYASAYARFGFDSLGGTLSRSIKTGAGVNVNFLFFGVAGPYVKPAGYIKGEGIRTTSPPEDCITVKGGGEVDIGGKVTILSLAEFQAYARVPILEMPIYRKCFPYTGPVEDAGSDADREEDVGDDDAGEIPAGTEDCHDGIDNDDDGDIDCRDTDCGFEGLVEISCDDDIDNDCDLAVDCVDEDCASASPCEDPCTCVGRNCGLNACGVSCGDCADGQDCNEYGQCVSSGECPAGQRSCGSTCCSISSEVCVNGHCCDSSTPDYCGDACVDTNTDPGNCGFCGVHCNTLQDCCDGQCENTKTDHYNCGDCGHWCGYEEACCNGHCSDLVTDLDNCGMCGNDCRINEDCCDGDCIDVSNDPYNCGVCWNTCYDDEYCEDGYCWAY